MKVFCVLWGTSFDDDAEKEQHAREAIEADKPATQSQQKVTKVKNRI